MDTKEIIKKIRKDLYFTQVEMADMLGVRQSYISGMENGKYNLSIGTLQKYCEILKVDLKINVNEL